MFPRGAVASVVGIRYAAGNDQRNVAWPKRWATFWNDTGSYVPVFILAGLAYVVALGFVQVLAPRMKPAKI